MYNWTLLIYLFFLERNNDKDRFYDEIFHFYRFISINDIYTWKRVFHFENKKIRDSESELTLRNLMHHNFIDSKLNITEDGKEFLSYNRKINNTFEEALVKFLNQYYYQPAYQDSCFVEHPHFTISCHLCKDHVCIDPKIKMSDVLNLLNIKGIKNPYKGHTL